MLCERRLCGLVAILPAVVAAIGAVIFFEELRRRLRGGIRGRRRRRNLILAVEECFVGGIFGRFFFVLGGLLEFFRRRISLIELGIVFNVDAPVDGPSRAAFVELAASECHGGRRRQRSKSGRSCWWLL